MRRSAAVLLLLGGASLLSASAEARTELLRWQHPNPSEVAHFVVHVGASPGSYGPALDVGVPSQQNGAYVYPLDVADGDDVYVAVSAQGTNGLPSAPSNEQLRAAPAPPPEPLGVPGMPRVVDP